DGIRYLYVTEVQTCALPIWLLASQARQEELHTLLALFAELCEVTPSSLKKEVEKLLRHVQLALPCLVTFCQPLDTIHQSAIDQRSEERRVGKECRYRWVRNQ